MSYIVLKDWVKALIVLPQQNEYILCCKFGSLQLASFT